MTWWGSLVRVQSRLPNTVGKSRAWRFRQALCLCRYGKSMEKRDPEADGYRGPTTVTLQVARHQVARESEDDFPKVGEGGMLAAVGQAPPSGKWPSMRMPVAKQVSGPIGVAERESGWLRGP